MSDLLGDTSTALNTTFAGGTALTALLSTVPNTGTAVYPAVYDMQAPDGATLPYLIYNHQGGGPDSINPSEIESNLWLVKAYSATSAQNASQIFAEADLLIHRKQLSINGGTVNTFWCAREENVKLVETLPSKQHVWMQGGLYRIRTAG